MLDFNNIFFPQEMARFVLHSPLPQPGPARSFHSQGVHGEESLLEELLPAADIPLDDACESAAYTPPTTIHF